MEKEGVNALIPGQHLSRLLGQAKSRPGQGGPDQARQKRQIM